jgi:hypothetical protein
MQRAQGTFVSQALLRSSALRLRGQLRALEDKCAAGDISTTQYAAEYEKAKKYIDGLLVESDICDAKDRVVEGVKGSDLAFAIAAGPSPQDTAWLALKAGALPGIALALVAAAGTILDSSFTRDPSPQVELAGRIVATLGFWLIGAFTFGYVFTYIRGRSGLTKGLRFGVVLVAVTVPLQFLMVHSLVDAGGLLLTVTESLGFYALLGLMFDYKAFRLAEGAQFRWSEFLRIGDLRGLTAIATVLGTSVGVALASALAGKLATVVGSLLQGLPPTTPPGT